MKLSTICVTLILILLGSACTKQQGENYFPEPSKGFIWEYSIEYTKPFAGTQQGKMLVRVDGEEVIDGKQYLKYVTVFSGIPGANSKTTYYRRTKNGIYGKPNKDVPEYLETPFPLTVGQTWSVGNPDSEIKYHVDSIETAELFNKKYDNCLKISFEGTVKQGESLLSIKGYTYKAEGIGEVKSSTIIEGVNKVIMDIELVKYEK